MGPQPNIATSAFLIGDPARAAMLVALLDGRAMPAGELAQAAGVTAQTASSHLAKLLAGGLVKVEAEGRHRYYRLGGANVAMALEHLASIAPSEPVRRKVLTLEARQLRFARCCYDHLAGRLGVAVTCVLQERGFLEPTANKQFTVTSAGAAWFGGLGLDITKIPASRRGLARQCLDWTERRHHVAGPLGVKFTDLLCAKGWIRRAPSSRVVEVTHEGWKKFEQEFGLYECDLKAESRI
ncbi:ArsR family transcriptional regulator [Nitrospirillum amazonense]|uniref:ArsR family transcriptional regulator n=1 Tax=Nitrospirillum amazonense TaxID=28077 RepID=A0A560FKF8_9PROT|nr:winged helix-turn-helix domain-containing protein [Nitrospirillum amazonense]TWB22091.1 ArsR family transcriptional regulator [Nitrospirillum amazonense]